jgi:hypothetical protein
MASALLLGRISLDLQQTERWFSTSTLRALSVVGLLIFFLVGLVPVFNAGDFLDYAALPIPNDDGQVSPHFTLRSAGIFVVEVGIALGVMATLTLIFDYLSENTRDAG